MKKLLLNLFFITLTFTCFGQKLPLPSYYINGQDTLGVIISVQQANKINNNLELTKKLEERLIKLETINNDYVLLIEEYEKNKSILLTTIAELEHLKETHLSMIQNLKDQNISLENSLSMCEEQRRLLDEIIEKQKKIIKKKNGDTWFIGAAAVLFGAGIGTWIGTSFF